MIHQNLDNNLKQVFIRNSDVNWSFIKGPINSKIQGLKIINNKVFFSCLKQTKVEELFFKFNVKYSKNIIADLRIGSKTNTIKLHIKTINKNIYYYTKNSNEINNILKAAYNQEGKEILLLTHRNVSIRVKINKPIFAYSYGICYKWSQ